MTYLKRILFFVLSVMVGVNLYFAFLSPVPYLVAWRRSLSLNAGQRYYGRLSLWYLYAQKGDWPSALKLESQLDDLDIASYRQVHYPPELKKTVNSLVFKNPKSPDDWVELARIQLVLNNLTGASESIRQAHLLDPIREDISAAYYQLTK